MRAVRPLRARVILCLLLLACLAACGKSPTESGGGGRDDAAAESAESVYAKAESLSGKDRIDYLRAQAKKEGDTLTLYSSYSANALKGLTAEFQKAYGIKVRSFRSTPETIAQRMQQEVQAHYAKGNDVVETRGFEMYRLNQAKLIRSLEGNYLTSIPKSGRFAGWTADRFVIITAAWNTSLVPKGKQPKSWADLADPRWRGKLAIEQLDDNWYETLHEYLVAHGSTTAQVDDMFERIVANARVISGHTQMHQLLASGQFQVAVDGYTYLAEQTAAEGAPVSYRPPISPAVSQPNGVGLMRTARHPAAAALFYQWILTSGQDVLARTGNTAATRLPKDLHTIPLDISGYAKSSKLWSDRYDKLLRTAHR